MGKPTTPPVAVDVIIELSDRPAAPIVLVRRRNPPHGWALPGGFVDCGETVASAAQREAREETGLEVTLRALLGVYSDPARDPRGQTVSIVLVGTASGRPEAGDDAAQTLVADPRELPALAFDHARIVADYLAFLDRGERRVPD